MLFGPLGVVLLLPRFGAAVGAASRGAALGAGLGAALGAYVVGAGMWIDPGRHAVHVSTLLFAPETVTIANAYHPPHLPTWGGATRLARDALHRGVDAWSLPVSIAALAGIALALRRRAASLVLLLPPLALFFVLLLPTGHALLRYQLPFTLIVAGFAAYALGWLRRSALRALWVPALVVLCGFQLLVAADLSYAQLRETRTAAGRWLAAHARPGDRVEYFGATQKLPPLSAAIRSRRVGGREHWHGQLDHGPALLAYLAGEGPEYVVVIPDWSSPRGADHSGDCPPEVRRALADGSLGYREVAVFEPVTLLKGPLRRPPLDNPSVSPPVRIFARADVAER